VPPRRCRRPPGYAEFPEVLGNPANPEHDRLRCWAGDWSASFDLATADLLVQQTSGAVPALVRLVLDMAAGGVKLTPGGRLPRTLVRQVQERYPSWYPLGPASIEEDLPPLAALHDLLRQVGLLRLRRGILTRTRVASDDIEVIRRLRSWFGTIDSFASILAGDALALLCTDGSASPQDLAARLFRLLGGRWVTSDGQPLDGALTLSGLYRLHSVLVGLDLIDETPNGMWTAGPSAQWLLPRATALAHLWSR
jgi:hypothetical protein